MEKRFDKTAVRIEDPAVRSIVMQLPAKNDPLGSYTGRPEDPREKPVQDADDL